MTFLATSLRRDQQSLLDLDLRNERDFFFKEGKVDFYLIMNVLCEQEWF